MDADEVEKGELVLFNSMERSDTRELKKSSALSVDEAADVGNEEPVDDGDTKALQSPCPSIAASVR